MQHRILLVDDHDLNRDLLRARLEPLGHDILEASSGGDALAVVEQERVDLVLLDVLMPGMDGFETLRRMKQLTAGRGQYLPVVLVTTLDDRESRRQGLDAGADEMLTKPVDALELGLRVRNLLALRDERLALLEYNQRLVELQKFKEEMTALLVHDLKNPTAVVLANLDFASGCIPPGSTPTLIEALDDARDGCRRSLRLLANLLDVARAEESHLEVHRSRVSLATIIDPLVRERQNSALTRGCRIETDIDVGATAAIDADLVSRIIANVLDNALRYTPRGGIISLRARHYAGHVQVRIGNTGQAIPSAERTTIFDKYNQITSTDERGLNRGLGLYFCRLAAEAHGGDIWVEEESLLPTVFVVTLPSDERHLQ